MCVYFVVNMCVGRIASLVYVSGSWHQNVSLFHPKTLFVPRHPLLLIRLPHMSESMMRRPKQTSLRTSLNEVFIQNTKSSCRTSPTLTYPLSFTVGDGSHCVMSWSPVHPCLFRSSTPTCMVLIFSTSVFYSHSRYTHCGHTRYCI